MQENAPLLALIVMTIPPALEDRLIDWLLDRDEPLGFSSSVVYAHDSDPSHLTVAEKVSGKQRRVEVQVRVPRARADALITELRHAFQGVDLHYWVVEIVAGGHLA